MLDSSDLAELQITKGQHKLLKKAIQDLDEAHTKKRHKDLEINVVFFFLLSSFLSSANCLKNKLPGTSFGFANCR